MILTSVYVVALAVLSARLGFDTPDMLISGLALGSLYALVAIGYTLVYTVTHVVNFAHGTLFVAGGLVSLTVMEHLTPDMAEYGSFGSGLNALTLPGLTIHVHATSAVLATLVVSMLVGGGGCALLGVLMERYVFRPLRPAPQIVSLVAAFGLAVLIENLLGLWRGRVPLTYPTIVPVEYVSALGPFTIGAGVRNIDVIVLLVSVPLMVIVERYSCRSTRGAAMRAVGEDREVARMIGMDVDWVVLTAFVLASTTAGAAGVLYGMQQTVLRPTAGLSLGMFALTGAFLGGIGTVRGAIYGGLLVGLGSRLMDQLGQGGGSDWREVAVFMALVAVLILRPEGLLGSQGYGDR